MTANKDKKSFLFRHGHYLVVLFWIMVIVLSFLTKTDQIEQRLLVITREQGKSLFQIIQLTRLWNARHGGLYAPVSDLARPNPYLDDPKRDIVTPEGEKLTKINPAFMTRQIAEIAASRGILFNITSLNPINPANMADEWETASLKRFEQKQLTDVIEVVSRNENRYFRYMAPLYTEKACLKCHAKQGYHEGDIRGGISVTVINSKVQQSYEEEKMQAVAFHALFFMVVTTLSVLLFFKYRNE